MPALPKNNVAPAVAFRPALRSDIPAIIALAQRVWRAHYPGIISQAQIDYMLALWYTPAALDEEFEKKNFLLAHADGKLIGYGGIREEREGEWFLSSLYVDPAQRNRGIGRLLLDELIRTHQPMRILRLQVNRQNFKSVNFYFREGFTIERCIERDIGEGFFMSDFVMARRFHD